ncbi:hypothetical protein AB0K21_21895 [Streptosporangium sp. NPDC049248]|uniref:hypothetical protein n=1 Tax=Streptosporangium sp. NPDC049248 TaxID=3155651 RepID=UPI003421CE57
MNDYLANLEKRHYEAKYRDEVRTETTRYRENADAAEKILFDLKDATIDPTEDPTTQRRIRIETVAMAQVYATLAQAAATRLITLSQVSVNRD